MIILNGKRYAEDGTVTDVEITSENMLKVLQEAVGGFIENVFPKQHMDVMFIANEEGLIRNMPINPKGCELYGTAEHGHNIHGPIVVFDRKAFFEFDRSLE